MITLAPVAGETVAPRTRLHDAEWRKEIEGARALRDALEVAQALGTPADPAVLRAAHEWTAQVVEPYDLDLDLLRGHLTKLLAHQVLLVLAENERLHRELGR